MKIRNSNRIKLTLFAIVLLLVSAACIIFGNSDNAPADPPAVDNPPANNPVEPKPVVEDPVVEPAEEDTQDEKPAEDPAPPPAPVTVPDEALRTTRLLPALKDVMLRPADLKIEYNMMNDKEVSNDRMINQITWGDGREYNGKTGRITGWNTYMERAQNEFGPFSYRTRIEVFETVEGAQIALSADWLFIFNDPNLEITEFLDLSCAYGNECVLAYHEENIAGTTDFYVEYHIVFRYHNVTVYVFAKGLEASTSEQTVFEIAELMISRLDMYK